MAHGLADDADDTSQDRPAACTSGKLAFCLEGPLYRVLACSQKSLRVSVCDPTDITVRTTYELKDPMKRPRTCAGLVSAI